jgi:DNA-binding GntR family transcriptional regulator
MANTPEEPGVVTAGGGTALRIVGAGPGQPLTLQDYVTEALSRAILEGRLRPGEKLSPHRLAAELNVSHIPVREALHALESAGHVTRIARRGFFVTRLSLTDVEDIYRWRSVLESEAHRVGVPRLEQSDFVKMKALNEKMARAVERKDRDAFVEANREFHFIPFHRAGSERLLRFLMILWDSAIRYQSVLVRTGGDMRLLQKQHDSLLRAFIARNPERVNRLSIEHRAVTLRVMRAALVPSKAGRVGDGNLVWEEAPHRRNLGRTR